jgi:hypothetical protein
MQPSAKLRSRAKRSSTSGCADRHVRSRNKDAAAANTPNSASTEPASHPSPGARFSPTSSAASAPASAASEMTSNADSGAAWRGGPPPGRAGGAPPPKQNPRHHVDQEQPVPGPGLGDPAAHDRPDSGREHRRHPGDRGRQPLRALRKQQEHRREYRRDQRPPEKALQDTPGDQAVETPACRATNRGQREQADRADKEPAHAEAAGQVASKRDGDNLGGEISGLDPTHRIGRDAERPADGGQRRGHDLDVEDRHEHAQAHGGKGEPDPQRGDGGRKSGHGQFV